LKRIWLSIALLLMCLALLSSSSNAEPTRTFGFTVSAGTAISVNGSYNEAVDMPNALEAGYDYDIAFDKWIGRHFRASMTVKLAWMKFKNGTEGVAGESPSFTVPALVFRNFYHFASGRIRPFVSGGTGLYFWRFNTDGVLGSVARFEGERQQKMSIGVNAGAGLEVVLSKNSSILIDPSYHYILSQDRFVFGERFTEQGFVTLDVGFSYYFSSSN